eukprot:6455799-Amphidinium_carterae.1
MKSGGNCIEDVAQSYVRAPSSRELEYDVAWLQTDLAYGGRRLLENLNMLLHRDLAYGALSYRESKMKVQLPRSLRNYC